MLIKPWCLADREVAEQKAKLMVVVQEQDAYGIRRQAKWWREFEQALREMVDAEIAEYRDDPEREWHHKHIADDPVLNHWLAQLDEVQVVRAGIKGVIRMALNG